MDKQQSFGKTTVSNTYCDKAGAASADTKGWSFRNKFGNISGNACGKDMYLQTKRILAEFVQLNRLDEVHKPHAKNPVSKNNRHHRCCGVFAGHIRAEIPTSNLQPCINNGDEGTNVPGFSIGEFDYVLRCVEPFCKQGEARAMREQWRVLCWNV